jgi:sporulation protein YqfC
MSFVDNILSSFGEEFSLEKESQKIMVFGDKGVFLEGVLGIKSFNKEQIVLFVKKGEIVIAGENLFVKKFCQGDVVVCGKINKIERN